MTKLVNVIILLMIGVHGVTSTLQNTVLLLGAFIPLIRMSAVAGADCSSSDVMNGGDVSSGKASYITVPITLAANYTPTRISPNCLAAYNTQLQDQLLHFSQSINTWICKSQNCTYLSGTGVSIDVPSSMSNWISDAQGMYYSLSITVNILGSFTTSSQNFAQCKVEIQNYLYFFSNWPPDYTPYLIEEIKGSGCPYPLPFNQTHFLVQPRQCPIPYANGVGSSTRLGLTVKSPDDFYNQMLRI